MSTDKGFRRPDRYPGFDRATAERLLNGGPEAWRTGQVRLAGLLAAASAPARAEELASEEAVLAAFIAVRPGGAGAVADGSRSAARRLPVRRTRRGSMLKTTLAKLLTIKVGAACAAVLGVGGVAVAASTHTLPGHLGFGTAPAPASSSHRPYPSGTPSARPSHSLPPNLLALCHDYLGRDRDHRGRALDDPHFRDLVDGAGQHDRDKVDNFCNDLEHRWPSGSPSVKPSGQPSGEISGWPSGRPNTGGGGPVDPSRPAPSVKPSSK